MNKDEWDDTLFNAWDRYSNLGNVDKLGDFSDVSTGLYDLFQLMSLLFGEETW